MQKKEQKIKQTNPFSEMEEEVLDFWDKGKIFEKSVNRPHPNPLLSKERGNKKTFLTPAYPAGRPLTMGAEKNRKDYVFYDGPPFATGLPHYGHIVASLMKDVVPRYWTMNGYRVERKWGWDCHGLPIENIVEKEMGSKSKKDIEAAGIDKFNEICRTKVLSYVEDWKKIIKRLGRWADMENAYKTMDLSYMESVWWVFKELYDKGLIYEGYRSMHICPRCETTLSQQEVAEGYKDIKDLSAVVKFELLSPIGKGPACRTRGMGDFDVILNEAERNEESRGEKTGSFAGAQDDSSKVYILAWTTTPWTLIGNVALAVGEDIDYVKIKYNNLRIGLESVRSGKGEEIKRSVITPGVYILAKDIVWKNLNSNGLIKDLISLVTYKMDLERDLVNSFREVRKKYGNIEGAQRDNRARNYFFKKYGKQYGFEVIKGKDLIGKKYKPLFDYYISKRSSTSKREVELPNQNNGWKIYGADFVTTDEGTGVVHIAPAFGEDDMNLAKEHNLPFIQHVGMDGVIKEEAKDFSGMHVKPIEDHMKTDIEIIKYLAHHNLLFSKEKYEHSYPHCWRCETPLINYATSSWFVSILKIKDKMLKTAKTINWSPAHIKEGRFGKWLKGARDWSISRQRFWASVIPIWRCDTELKVESQKLKVSCRNIKVFGSIKELEDVSGKKVEDLHKHAVDKITFFCEKCGGTMKRVPDVLDCWFESGSMPYAQMHYPFENKEKFENNFPAEFIAEGSDQTRAWFYYLHAIANGIKKTHAFKNVIVNGIVLAEDGKKMAKRLNNYPDPSFIFNQYGADALRYYLLTSPVMLADNLCFSEGGVKDALRKVNMILWNVYKFYELFAKFPVSLRGAIATKQFQLEQLTEIAALPSVVRNDNVLDKWILSRLNQLIGEVMENMKKYNLPKATRPIGEFVNDLSIWYIRRSRDRFKGDDKKDKEAALQTTGYVLLQLAKVMAPFMPFMAEQVWQKVSGNNFKDDNQSVHLEGWPSYAEAPNGKPETQNIIKEMEMVRKIVELGLAKRDEAGIKVKQPLQQLKINNLQLTIREEHEKLIKDELNIKKIIIKKGKGELSAEISSEITLELKMEGMAREIVRFINTLRKNAGMTIQDRMIVYWQSDNKEIREVFKKYGKEIIKETLSRELVEGLGDEVQDKKEVKIDGLDIILGIKKL